MILRLLVMLMCCFSCFVANASGPFSEPLENISVLRAEHVVSFRVLGFARGFGGTEDFRSLEVELRTRAGVRLYSKGIHMQTFDASGLPLALSFRGTPPAVKEFDKWYQEEREFYGAGTIFSVESAQPFLKNGELRIRFEACNTNKCLMPETFRMSLVPGSEGEAGSEFVGGVEKEKREQSGEKRELQGAPNPAVVAAEAPPQNPAPVPAGSVHSGGVRQSEPLSNNISVASAPEKNSVTTSVAQGVESRISEQVLNGGIWVLPLLFLAGLLMNLTPCVYPMIPITLSVLGRFRKKESRGGAWIPLVFVLGVAASYSGMGVIAGLSGNVFGAILQSVWVQLGISLLMVLMGLAMVGFLNFSKLQEWGSRIPLSEKSPYGGAFVMGCVSGLVSAPCTGPVLATLLLLVSQTQDAIRGFVLLFVFAFGFGAPYLVLGLMLHRAKRLPHLGFFEEVVKLVFAALIFALAFYYARGVLSHFSVIDVLFQRPAAFVVAAFGALALLLLVAAHFVSRNNASYNERVSQLVSKWIRSIAILPLTVLALWLTLWALKAFPSAAVAIRWETSWETARLRAAAENKPLVVDVWADWCASCREMDATLWNQPDVSNLVNTRFVALKLDFTEESDESKLLTRVWNLGGLPAVGFFAKGVNTREAPTKLYREKLSPENFFAGANGVLEK